MDTQVILIFILIEVQYSQKAVFSFEKGSNHQNHSSPDSLHLVKKILPSKISDSPQPLATIWKTTIYKTLCAIYAPPWGDSLLFTRNSWSSLNQSQKDERLRWPWSHPVVLNLCINLVITKYKLKPQYVKLTQLWPLTVNYFKKSEFSVLSGRLIKNMFFSFAHM